MQLRQCNIGVPPEVYDFWEGLSYEQRNEVLQTVNHREAKKRELELSGAPSLANYMDAGVITNILLNIARATRRKLVDRQKLCNTITNFLNVIPKATRQESAHDGRVKEFDEEDACRQLVLALEIFPSGEDLSSSAKIAIRYYQLTLFWFYNKHVPTDTFDWELIYGPLQPLTKKQATSVKFDVPLTFRCKQFRSWKAILHEWCKTAMYPKMIPPLQAMQKAALGQFYDSTNETQTCPPAKKIWSCTDDCHLGLVDLRLWLVLDMNLANEDTGLWILTVHEEIERLGEKYKVSDASNFSEDVMKRAMYEKEVYTDYEALGRHVAAFMLMQNMFENGFYTRKSSKTLPTRDKLITLLKSETCGGSATDAEASFKFGTHWLYKELYGDVGSTEASRLLFPTDYTADSFLHSNYVKYEQDYNNCRQVYGIWRGDNRRWKPWDENWLELDYPSIADWVNTPTSTWKTKQCDWENELHVNFLQYITESVLTES